MLCCFYIDIWYSLSSLAVVLVCIQAFGIDFPVWLQTMFLLYRNLVQTFQFGYSSSLYTGFFAQSFQFGYMLIFLNIDILYRLSNSDIVLVCIQAFYIDFLSSLPIGYVAFIQTFGTDFPVWLQFQFVYWLFCIDFPAWLQAMMFLYRHLVQTFQFGYSSSLYTGFLHRLSFQFAYWLCCFYIDIWYRLSSLAIVLVCILAFGIDVLSSLVIGNVVFIQTFGTDFPVWLQFQFVYRLLVQAFQFGNRPCFYYIEIWYRLSISAIVLICILAFGIDFPAWLQAMMFLYRPLVQTFQFGFSSSFYTGFWYRRSFQFGQAMMFLYRHLVQSFQFGYSSSLYTSFCHRLSFQFSYKLRCLYIDIWYRLSSLAIVPVCILAFAMDFLSSLTIGYVVFIQTFGRDFPIRLQFQFVYLLLVQTFLSSFAIGNVVLVQTFGTDFLVWLQFQFVYLLLIQTFQLGYRL